MFKLAFLDLFMVLQSIDWYSNIPEEVTYFIARIRTKLAFLQDVSDDFVFIADLVEEIISVPIIYRNGWNRYCSGPLFRHL